jgi:hypothetical protein
MPIFFDANRGDWQSASAPDLIFDGPFVDSIPTTKRKSSIGFSDAACPSGHDHNAKANRNKGSQRTADNARS